MAAFTRGQPSPGTRAITKPDALAAAIGPSALSLTLVLGLIDRDKLYVTVCLSSNSDVCEYNSAHGHVLNDLFLLVESLLHRQARVLSSTLAPGALFGTV